MRLPQHAYKCAAAAAALGALLFSPSCAKPPVQTLQVQVDKPGGDIAPGMFGIFFEDINFAADGGLYPELVKNRSFEFNEPVIGWGKIDNFAGEGQLNFQDKGGLNEANTHYLRLHIVNPDGFGISNTGLRGMGVAAGEEYSFSAWVRVPGDGPKTMHAAVVGPKGEKLGEADLSGFGNAWKRYETTLKVTGTQEKAKLNLTFPGGKGDIDLDVISLFPKNTFKNRPNGLRRDLVQLLADMHPGFIRFPGGCIVEGKRIPMRYQWKKTVGDIAERKSMVNRWNDELPLRQTPDYYQSFGLGFYEYFQLAEDIGASPLPVLSCGMACQFDTNELVPMDQLDPYIQDALDLIEFANGDVKTKWGGLRAKMGHPEPFNMKMIGVGNEQWGQDYVDRAIAFGKVLKAKHPEIMIISGAGPSSDGKDFDFLWGKMRELKAEIVDEHYYKSPKWFLENSGRYDKYDRNGPKVFAGEYAAQTVDVVSPDNRNSWEAALSEAAFMTGLDRNADLVRMASYAPLFAHVEGWQWTPDLIWFDNLRSYGTPNYYVQKLFSTNHGNRILPVTMGGSTKNAQNGLYSSASLDEKTGEVIVKVVNAGKTSQTVKLDLAGASAKGQAKSLVLASADLKAENSLDKPKNLAPVESTVPVNGSSVDVNAPAYSVTVLRIPTK